MLSGEDAVRGEAAAAAAAPEALAVPSMLGLQKAVSWATAGPKSRPAPVKAPMRTGPVWATVEVLEQVMSQTPKVKCLGCGLEFCGGITPIEEHVLKKCSLA